MVGSFLPLSVSLNGSKASCHLTQLGAVLLTYLSDYDFQGLRVSHLPLHSQYPSVCLAVSRPLGVWTVRAEQSQHFCKGPHAASAAHAFCLQPFKNVKLILSSWVIQIQATSLIWPGDHSWSALGIESQGLGSGEGPLWVDHNLYSFAALMGQSGSTGFQK